MRTKLTPEHRRRIVRRTRALVVQSGLLMSPWLDMHSRSTGAFSRSVARDAASLGMRLASSRSRRRIVLRHAIDDDDSAAEPTLLPADTCIPVFGKAAVGGEWPRITSESSQARLWPWVHTAILSHRRDLMRGCGKQA